MNYKDIIMKTEQFLDTIPMEKYLTSGCDLREAMNQIEEDYSDLLSNDEFFRGYVFNWMSTDEFASYLKRKGYKVHSEIIERFYAL